MATVGFFDVTADPEGWFDDTADPKGWFDDDLIDTSGGNTYTKTGFGKAGCNGLGADSWILNKSGVGISGLVGAGTSASVFVESGYATVGSRTSYYDKILSDTPVGYFPLDEPPTSAADATNGRNADISGRYESNQINPVNMSALGAGALVDKKGRQQMLPNPDFETNLAPVGCGWWNENSSTLTRVTSEFLTGTASCKVDTTASGAGIRSAWWQSPVAASQGTRVTARAWVKGTAGNIVRTNILETKSDHTSTGVGHVSDQGQDITLNGGWQLITWDFVTSNVNCAFLDLYLQSTTANPTQTFYVDSVNVFLWDQSYAVDFDGVDDLIQAGDSAPLSPTTAVSVEAWIRADTFGATYRTIVSKAGSYWLRVDKSGTAYHLQFFVTADGSTYSGFITNTVTLLPGQTYHVVGTYDGANCKVYLNGQPNGSVAKTGGINNSTGTLIISQNTADICWDGIIDEVSIYDYALGDTKVLDHYNAAKGGTQGSNAVIYVESGSGKAGAFGSGTDVDIATETGFGKVGINGAGSKAGTILNKTGFGTAGANGLGPSESLTQETGAGVLSGSGIASDALIYVESGTGKAGCNGFGADVDIATESGFGTVGTVGAGIGSKFGDLQKKNFGSVGLIGAGVDNWILNKRNFGTVGSVATGSRDTVIHIRTGFGAAGGVGIASNSVIYVESGNGSVAGNGYGSSSSLTQETGKGIVGADGHGADTFIATESGRGVAGTVGSGESASIFQKVGFGISGLTATGRRDRILTKTNYSVVSPDGTGADVFIATETGFGIVGTAGYGTAIVVGQVFKTGYGLANLVGGGKVKVLRFVIGDDHFVINAEDGTAELIGVEFEETELFVFTDDAKLVKVE